jgi:N-ethylmaleimide reductase
MVAILNHIAGAIMSTADLFQPLTLGRFTLSHRVVMAPLTRMRAGAGNVPQPVNAEYYRQRASKGGLLITEATPVTPTGHGYPQTPGIHTADQVEGWKAVTEAVHDKGGLIFAQLWHVGRISHSSLQPGGGLPVSASAIPAAGNALTATWQQVPFETPRALDTAEIPALIEAYRQAAKNAEAAGFDGVEIHSANGYLLQQFLESRTNHRTDAYGGSIENRVRLVLEVVEAVVGVLGADRVGIRLSPFTKANDSGEDDPRPLYSHLLSKLAPFGLAYLHMVEARAENGEPAKLSVDALRPLWPGVLIAADGYTGATATTAVASGRADAVAFGRLFIANPDLPERLRRDAPLNAYDRATFYGGAEAGYTDYPVLETV